MEEVDIDPTKDYDSGLVEAEEDDADIEVDDEGFQLVGCTCDCDPTDHDKTGCENCEDCGGHWE